jgi:GH25 family lysozyme M1 (1,4-beta-N-acetylmuramidase)
MRLPFATCLAFAACAAPDPAWTSREEATTVCGGAATVRGVDVSAYETSVDWAAAKASGIEFGFIRATDGTGYRDPRFAAYWAAARAAGVIRGAYQFFRPAEDPIAQAELLLSLMGPHVDGDLPPALDVETSGGLAPDAVAAAVQAWVDHVAEAIGRPPIIYAGYYSWPTLTGGANLTASPLWHAQYTTAPCPNIAAPWTAWRFWQYSSTGVVPGLVGEASDLDVFDGSLDELRAFAAAPPAACGVIGPAGGAIDDVDACFHAGGPASGLRRVSDAGAGGGLLWTHATAAASEGNFGQWDLTLAEAGTYRVEVYTAAAYAQSRRAAYEVVAAGARTSHVVDQTARDGWQLLGDVAFAAGGGQYVHLGDDTGEAGGATRLVFDAVRLTRRDGPAGGGDAGDVGGGDGGDGGGAARGGGCAAAGGGAPWSGGSLVLLGLAGARGRAAKRRDIARRRI